MRPAFVAPSRNAFGLARMFEHSVRGYSLGGVANTVAIAIVVWLDAALALAERRAGYVISLPWGKFLDE